MQCSGKHEGIRCTQLVHGSNACRKWHGASPRIPQPTAVASPQKPARHAQAGAHCRPTGPWINPWPPSSQRGVHLWVGNDVGPQLVVSDGAADGELTHHAVPPDEAARLLHADLRRKVSLMGH